jgi:hypothetical protein
VRSELASVGLDDAFANAHRRAHVLA